MSIFKKIDDYVIDDIYQPIVNKLGLEIDTILKRVTYLWIIVLFSQVSYNWIVEQKIYYSRMVLLTLIILVPYRKGRAERIHPFYLVFRNINFIMMLWTIIEMSLPHEEALKMVLRFIENLIFTSIYYFAACVDAPPRRKVSNVWQTQGI